MKQAVFLVLTFLSLCFCSLPAKAISATDSSSVRQRHFLYAQRELQRMLEGEEALSYERAIFLIENAWWEGRLDSARFRKELDSHIRNISSMILATPNPKGYIGELGWMENALLRKESYRMALSNRAVFSYLTKASLFTKNSDSGNATTFLHIPYEYAWSDPFGHADWTHTQVTNLLNGKQGNCFALASLFYIFSERFESDARLCTTPGHIYIRHADDRGVRYNIELSNGTFPGTGTLATLSYTTREALQNNISLRELDRKQSIALCLVYLAKGYEQKCGNKGNEFSAQCAKIALQHDPQNLNAMLLQAEGLEERLISQGQTATIARTTKDGQRYEKLIGKLYELGYREMPGEMKAILLAGYCKDTLNYKPRSHTPQPFVRLGDTARYASLSWGLFDEMHEVKPTELYGRTLFDTKTRRLCGFLEKTIQHIEGDFDPVVFAWNVDPLAHQFPWQSPYAAMDNCPILKCDPTGASGIAKIKGDVIIIKSTNFYYGDGVTAQLAKQDAKGVEATWNAANAVKVINGKTYRVQFEITPKVIGSVKKGEEARLANTRVDRNYIAVGRNGPYTNTKTNAMADDKRVLGGNEFDYNQQDLASNNKSSSHEQGHGYGWFDPNLSGDENFEQGNGHNTEGNPDGSPGLMQDRGTIPRSGEQNRKATQEDVDKLNVDWEELGRTGQTNVGEDTTHDGDK